MGQCISLPSHSPFKRAILLWDIENMPPPLSINIRDLIHHIQSTYITSLGYTLTRSICSLTRDHLSKFDKRREDQLISMSTTILLASSFAKKRDSDFVLKREMSNFMAEHKTDAHNSKIIIITSDSDFANTIALALQLSFDVQLIFNSRKCNSHLTSLPFKVPPVNWIDLLTIMNNGICPNDIDFNMYPPIHIHKQEICVTKMKTSQTKSFKSISTQVHSLDLDFPNGFPFNCGYTYAPFAHDDNSYQTIYLK